MKDMAETIAGRWLHAALGLGRREKPFPWQRRLLQMFLEGDPPEALDIPTGLGKTSLMSIWLVARALGAPLPRRLVYVVDRRAVVDQATLEAERLRAFVSEDDKIRRRLGLGERMLPVSTLRGQYADNHEWQEDPSTPAIIVGTVDMIGSRLLFQGYGVSRRMRPYHAALLGVDSLIVLDEAHLVPAFERLLDAVIRQQKTFGPIDVEARAILPKSLFISLSATAREKKRNMLQLDDDDFADPTVAKRVGASKRLRIIKTANERNLVHDLVEAAWELTKAGTRPVRCIVFTNSRDHALRCRREIEKRARSVRRAGRKDFKISTELMVGGRRVFERQDLQHRLADKGFLAGTVSSPKLATFLFATSAGEVGVDLDADCAVFDLVPWERIVQRLGRVNRRGDGRADVIVIAPHYELGADPRTDRERRQQERACRLQATERLLRRLPPDEDAFDASPGSLHQLAAADANDVRQLLKHATTPEPLRPEVNRALVDAWSLTSLPTHPGRPEVGPWLRGWLEDEQPQSRVVWRTYMPTWPISLVKANPTGYRREVEGFFESAPVQMSEVMETETFRLVDWLGQRADRIAKGAEGPDRDGADTPAVFRSRRYVAIVLNDDGSFYSGLDFDSLRRDAESKQRLFRILAHRTVVLDASLAGIHDGILDSGAEDLPWTLDGSITLETSEPESSERGQPSRDFRVRFASRDGGVSFVAQPESVLWRERRRFTLAFTADGEAKEWLIVEKRRGAVAGEEDRSMQKLQLLDEHQHLVAKKLEQITLALGLPPKYVQLFELAALKHDEGKRSTRWQQAFQAPSGTRTYAKTPGPIRYSLLDGYRHELGSLLALLDGPDIASLSEDVRELLLHVVIAHHGNGRPFITIRSCEELPPSALSDVQQRVAMRFVELTRAWGPWGLAWLETLLRSADFQASRETAAGEHFEHGEIDRLGGAG